MMRLKNKKTGEIVEATDFNIISDYNSLAELEEEWEDYKEPKGYWGYDTFENDVTFNSISNEDDRKADQEIGNYFNTREEAEKAVERLRAWKRLKDKGFRFFGVKGLDYAIDFEINPPYTHITFDEYTATEDQKEFYNDLMLLFGGEE